MNHVVIPRIEVLAALRQSRRTAEREGFPRTAKAVEGYVNEVYDLEQGDIVALGDDTELRRLVDVESGLWKYRCSLKEREATLEQRIARAQVGSRPWHQLLGQLLELQRILVQLMHVQNGEAVCYSGGSNSTDQEVTK